jgi:hypothetical protein
MRTISSRLLVLFGALLLAPAVAHAGEDEQQKALQLFDKGRKLAKEGRCAEAIAPLQESLRYAEGVGTLLNLGNCFETLGKMASAHRAFVRAQEVAARNDDKRQNEAKERAKAVEKDVSTLMVHVPASMKSGTDLAIDGESWPKERWDVPWPIDPGPHEIDVTSPPSPRHTESVTVKPHADHAEWSASLPSEGPQTTTKISLPENPKKEPENAGGSTQKTLAYVAGGGAGLGVATGIVAGIISLSAHSALTGRCTGYPNCNYSDREQLDKMNGNAFLAGNISTIGFIAGGALLITAFALYFTAPK